MMTLLQQQILDFLAQNPGALPTDIVAALYPTDANGDLIVSIALAALEKKGLMGADNGMLPQSRIKMSDAVSRAYSTQESSISPGG